MHTFATVQRGALSDFRWPISALQEKQLKLKSLISPDKNIFIQQVYGNYTQCT